MDMNDVLFALLCVLSIAMWAHGFSVGNLKGFWQGCNLWRPAYYRLYESHMHYRKEVSELILSHNIGTEEDRDEVRAGLAFIDQELAEIKEATHD